MDHKQTNPLLAHPRPGGPIRRRHRPFLKKADPPPPGSGVHSIKKGLGHTQPQPRPYTPLSVP